MVRVVPDLAGLHREFDYLVPARLGAAAEVGRRVRIPLHGRRVAGWVVAVDVEPPPDVALRDITGDSGLGPTAELVELARWAAWRWAGPLPTMLGAASPSRNVTGLARPPAWPAIEPAPIEPAAIELAGGALGDLAGRALGYGAIDPVVVRVPPGSDLLPLVEAALTSLGGPGGDGRPGSVLVLVPNLGWAGRLAERLARRGWPVGTDWASARAGWPVVLGTRAAAFAPVPALAGVVVLDAHDESYRSEAAPTLDATVVAAERARRAGVPCLLVSPCPSVVQLAGWGDGGRPPLEVLEASEERRGWPLLDVVDRRAADPRTGLLSEELATAVRLALDGLDGDGRAGEPGADPAPVICVLNRTGRARLLACASCGELARCEHCGRVVEQRDDHLVCPSCATSRPMVCVHCGATRLKILRPGIARVREELEALLGVAVAELSGPAGRSRPVAGRHRRAGDAAEEPDGPAAPVIVGTEAALHRIRRARLVAFLDFDQHLLAPRFTAAEEALGLLARAGRLVAWRRRAAQQVLVQTRMPQHAVLVAAAAGDPAVVVADESALRSELDLPPSSALATLRGEGATAFADDLAALAGGPVELVGLDDRRTLVRAPGHRALCDALAAVERPRGALRVALDPTDL